MKEVQAIFMSSLLAPIPPPPLSQYFPNLSLLVFFLSLQAGTRKACLLRPLMGGGGGGGGGYYGGRR
jgi:hypothetical protein